MMFNRTKEFHDIIPAYEVKTLIYLAKKNLPDTIYNMANLEGNTYTYPEIQTLLDGITIGGHKVSEEQQIYDLKKSWEYLFSIIQSPMELNKDLFNRFNDIIAKNEALISGKFRTGQVRIGGTEYMPPKADDLSIIFSTELEHIITRCNSKTELSLELFLFGALSQFYFDGNKRTGRMVANSILLSEGQGILNIKAKDKLEFNTLMVEFYDTLEADNICGFLYNKCIERC